MYIRINKRLTCYEDHNLFIDEKDKIKLKKFIKYCPNFILIHPTAGHNSDVRSFSPVIMDIIIKYLNSTDYKCCIVNNNKNRHIRDKSKNNLFLEQYNCFLFNNLSLGQLAFLAFYSRGIICTASSVSILSATFKIPTLVIYNDSSILSGYGNKINPLFYEHLYYNNSLFKNKNNFGTNDIINFIEKINKNNISSIYSNISKMYLPYSLNLEDYFCNDFNEYKNLFSVINDAQFELKNEFDIKYDNNNNNNINLEKLLFTDNEFIINNTIMSKILMTLPFDNDKMNLHVSFNVLGYESYFVQNITDDDLKKIKYLDIMLYGLHLTDIIKNIITKINKTHNLCACEKNDKYKNIKINKNVFPYSMHCIFFRK